jgi:hypothetical protein
VTLPTGPTFEYFQTVLVLLLKAAGTSIFLSLLIATLGSLATKQKFLRTLVFISPFGWLGTVIGLIAGESQEALVGAMLSGLLTVIAALMSYAFSKDALADWRSFMPLAIVLLCVSALIGLGLGRASKAKWDEFERSYAVWKTQYENVDVPMMKVRIRYQYCRANTPSERVANCESLLIH